MNKKLLSLVIFGSLILPVLTLAVAQPPPTKDVWTIITNITNLVYGLLLAVAVLFVIIAGFQYLTAGGDPEKLKTARDKIMYAAIAVLVGVAATGIVNIVKAL